MMKILIIGGTGVLSTSVTAEAMKKGFSVTMINRGNRRIPDGVEHIKADMNDHKFISEKLAGRHFDAVMDFLCYSDEATRKSVELYSNHTKQYFFISSCAVYDTASLNGQMGNEESKKVLPIWSYSVYKWKSEELLMSLFEGKDAHYTVVRPCVTYDNTRIPYGIVPPYGYHWTICARMLAGKPIITWNKGSNRCNMMRVEDFAVGVVGLVGNPKAYNQAFNVCGDEAPSFRDVLDCLETILGVKAQTVDITSDFYAKEVPSKKGEILGGRSINALNDNGKIKKVVPEFAQRIKLQEGISMTVEAYKHNNFENGIDYRFDGETDRIIDKWYRENGFLPNEKIKFVDYLNNASLLDKLIYWGSFNNESFFAKIVMKAIFNGQRLQRMVKKIKLKFNR